MNKASAKPAPRAGFGRTLHNTLVYVQQHWQLYVFFMLPAFALTIIFRYIPRIPPSSANAERSSR